MPRCAGCRDDKSSWFMTVWKSAVVDGGFLELNSTRLSEEQLKCLLEECVSQQKCVPLALSSGGENKDVDAAPEAPQLCPSTPCGLPDESEVEVQKSPLDDANRLEDEGCGPAVGSYLTRALAGHYKAEALMADMETMKELQFAKEEAFSDAADYFMSKTVGIGRLKKPPFLEDALDAIDVESSSEDQQPKPHLEEPAASGRLESVWFANISQSHINTVIDPVG
ncbi:Fibrous sheath-interacting protein 1 [Microtus ochrogaster]|uniref:Fibrous sheath-interacting protein 1 n=1 Tax=Microtus ochrogaster TaxID=79684 RepID=A0A8J6KV82_MICOH|nr:Fibrous sheath-interacting protein 1 [Microtus ochrogaster]